MKVRNKFKMLFFPHDYKLEHSKALDGLRGIAVILVLLSHSSGANMFFHSSLNFKNTGKIGVYLFFVLSAYLLDRQITIAFLKSKATKKYWKNYFFRRFLRIYPLFIISLMIHWFFTLFGINTVINQLIDIPLHLILVKGESVFWSIPVEFKYYFISPFIIYFCHRFLKWEKLKLFIFFTVIIVFTMIVQFYHPLSSPSTLRYFPIFIVGTVIAIYEIIFNKEFNNHLNNRLLNVLGWLAIIFILVTIPYLFNNLFGFKIDFLSAKYYLPYAVIWGIILLSAKNGKSLIRAFLEASLLRFIGVISFSIYLFHMLFLEYVSQLLIPQNLKIYLFLVLTFVFSVITYLLIERPFSKLSLNSKKHNQFVKSNEKIRLSAISNDLNKISQK